MTFKFLYDEIKKFDKHDKLYMNCELDTIILTLNEIYKIVAYDNDKETYLEIMLKDKQLSHFHMDYMEAKDVLMTAVLSDKPLPTEKEWYKIDRYNILFSLALVFSPCILLLILVFAVGIQTWIMPLRLLVFFGSFPLCWAVILYFHKRYKEKNKNIYEKIENLKLFMGYCEQR